MPQYSWFFISQSTFNDTPRKIWHEGDPSFNCIILNKIQQFNFKYWPPNHTWTNWGKLCARMRRGGKSSNELSSLITLIRHHGIHQFQDWMQAKTTGAISHRIDIFIHMQTNGIRMPTTDLVYLLLISPIQYVRLWTWFLFPLAVAYFFLFGFEIKIRFHFHSLHLAWFVCVCCEYYNFWGEHIEHLQTTFPFPILKTLISVPATSIWHVIFRTSWISRFPAGTSCSGESVWSKSISGREHISWWALDGRLRRIRNSFRLRMLHPCSANVLNS